MDAIMSLALKLINCTHVLPGLFLSKLTTVAHRTNIFKLVVLLAQMCHNSCCKQSKWITLNPNVNKLDSGSALLEIGQHLTQKEAGLSLQTWPAWVTDFNGLSLHKKPQNAWPLIKLTCTRQNNSTRSDGTDVLEIKLTHVIFTGFSSSIAGPCISALDRESNRCGDHRRSRAVPDVKQRPDGTRHGLGTDHGRPGIDLVDGCSESSAKTWKLRKGKLDQICVF